MCVIQVKKVMFGLLKFIINTPFNFTSYIGQKNENIPLRFWITDKKLSFWRP